MWQKIEKSFQKQSPGSIIPLRDHDQRGRDYAKANILAILLAPC